MLALVEQAAARTGWTVGRVLKCLGLSKGRYYEWVRRAAADRLVDQSTATASSGGILEEEKRAVVRYALAHPKDGYRRLAWQMVDEDVAYVSPSSVYRILNDADLLYRWKRSRGVGEPPPRRRARSEASKSATFLTDCGPPSRGVYRQGVADTA